ncbi:MAG: undecaprenyldiphospho-muramoylpentapeptide beta-N-acetylglucosaminyltransferase [Bacillota bacterium]|nr:undecaprenyldiphospho-muramoylpentapeptide beta-N-acetylglucosaminyltransferase [Bacillota bacterium]
MKIILTGGGTGGHIYPALALYSYLKEQYGTVAEFIYVGTSQGLEAEIVPKYGIQFVTIDSAGFSRKVSIKNIIALFKATNGLRQARSIIKSFKPDIVVGTGGFVCGPMVLMASLLRVPTLIHEQNALPGITNKILAPFVNKICITFPEAAKHFSKASHKVEETGLPIRPQILTTNRNDALLKLGLDKEKLTLLVVGGSRGAKSINAAMYHVISALKENNQVQVLMITGKAGYNEFYKGLLEQGLTDEQMKNIIIKQYLDEMELGLAAADLVIARAGATFLAEITAMGIPSILIPYPYASENHQEHNAQSLVNTGGAIMIKDKELTGELLLKTIESLISNKPQLMQMGEKIKQLGKPEAIVKLANIIITEAKNSISNKF